MGYTEKQIQDIYPKLVEDYKWAFAYDDTTDRCKKLIERVPEFEPHCLGATDQIIIICRTHNTYEEEIAR